MENHQPACFYIFWWTSKDWPCDGYLSGWRYDGHLIYGYLSTLTGHNGSRFYFSIFIQGTFYTLQIDPSRKHTECYGMHCCFRVSCSALIYFHGVFFPLISMLVSWKVRFTTFSRIGDILQFGKKKQILLCWELEIGNTHEDVLYVIEFTSKKKGFDS